MRLISFFSWLSWRLFRLGSEAKSKNDMSVAGMWCWCFETHRGVITPSGKIGESGDSGEMGECRIHAGAPPPEEVIGEDKSGEIDGGLAFRAGKVYSFTAISI